MINSNYEGTKYSYWLKSIASSLQFIFASSGEYANIGAASGGSGVRPRFLIG